MLREFSVVALVLLGATALAQNGLAQNPQSTSPVNPTVPVPPPAAPTAPPEQVAPPNTGMSNRLSEGKGTITPPNVDPGMAVMPPAKGVAKTPVIPPPGSPGGSQSVVPK